MDPVLLLPPSEAKRVGGVGRYDPERGRFGILAPARRQVAAALVAAMDEATSVSAVTGMKGERAARAAVANRTVLGAPTLPAGERYTGVVWSHLAPETLSPRARGRAEGLVVVSALGGLFAFDDPVPDYKLKMSARLPVLGPLAAFWRGPLSVAIADLAAGRTVWDLLPEEHRRAIDPGCLGQGDGVRVAFRAGSGTRAAGHGAKAAKGRFVRHLLDARQPGLDAAASFRWEGWRGEVAGPGLVVVRAPS